MSALNVVQKLDRVIILTDGASYRRNGVLHEISRKCHDVPGRPMVVATSGSVRLSRDMRLLLPEVAQTIDDVAKAGPSLFRSYMDGAREQLTRIGREGALFVVAGWSDVVQAPIYVTYKENRGETWFHISPNSIWAPLTEGLPRIDPSTFDPMTDGIAMMERQRLDATGGDYLVGGHIQLTEVTRAGITHRIIHEWPEDTVGERINPHGASRLAA